MVARLLSCDILEVAFLPLLCGRTPAAASASHPELRESGSCTCCENKEISERAAQK